TRSNLFWVSTGYDKDLGDGNSVQTGSGYAYSTDHGNTWTHVNQTLDQRTDTLLSYGINDSLWILPVVVPDQNVTFDISFSSTVVGTASWPSGLPKSSNNGLTWRRILLPTNNQNTPPPSDPLWTYALNAPLRFNSFSPRLDPRRNNN